MKIGNFGSFDPELKKRGIVGLVNASKLDKVIWDEFNNNWDKLAYESELLIAKFLGEDVNKYIIELNLGNLPIGKTRDSIVKVRINQNFFRQTILSAYNNKCCITKINIPSLLIASHIIPWSHDEKNRLNPHNGLCLNAIHDKAFDKGYLTITPDYLIKISKAIHKYNPINVINDLFIKYDNKKIMVPERFIPSKDFLDYHYKKIFIK